MQGKIPSMKNIVLLIIATFVFNTSFAQDRKQRQEKISDTAVKAIKTEMNAQARRKKMEDLNLSREQKKQVRDMKKQQDEAKAAIENDPSLTPEQKRDKMRELRKARQEKLKKILTPEQKEKLRNAAADPE